MLYLDINSLEVPILDGSSGRFVDEIRKAGIEEQDALRKYLVIKKSIEVRQENKVAGVYPELAFPGPHTSSTSSTTRSDTRKSRWSWTPESYCREIAMARTFGFVSDIEYLKSLGLIRGGSLENAVVLDSSGIVNSHLRFPNEFVRHKLLDLLGDISLIGYPIIGHLYAERARTCDPHRARRPDRTAQRRTTRSALPWSSNPSWQMRCKVEHAGARISTNFISQHGTPSPKSRGNRRGLFWAIRW